MLGLTGIVGVVGLGTIATSPVSAATWILGPFVVGFAVFGLGGSAVRLLRRDDVVVDPGRRQMSTFGRTVPIPGRLRVEVTKGVLNARPACHVDLVSSEGALRVADFVSRATADRLAAELPAAIAWPGPA